MFTLIILTLLLPGVVIGSLDEKSFPVRKFGDDTRFARRDRFPWFSITPAKVTVRSKKYTIPYGASEDLLDSLIDALPPFQRTEAMNALLSANSRTDAHSFENVMEHHSSIREYAQNIIGNMYIEIELLFIIVRIGFRMFQNGEEKLTSAIAVIKYLRRYSTRRLNHSFNFYSARNLVDLFEIFASKDRFRWEMDVKNLGAWKKEKKCAPGTLLSLEMSPWKQIIQNRLNRLILTGYENIDL